MPSISVPLVDLAAQQAEIMSEIAPSIAAVLRTATFVGGPEVNAFEQEYANYVGARCCVGVANGTDALELALRAVGVRPGGEVIVPVNTFVATAEAVSAVGARPVFVDVDPEYLLIDPEKVARAVGPRTQAIIPVHLFGQVAPMERLAEIAGEAGVPMVEDAAQAQGASRYGRRAGTLATVAATSFYPGKNLGAAGDAGAVTTDDEEIAERVRMLAAHGSRTKYRHEIVGMNSRLDTLQAVVLRAKLTRLEAWNELRRRAAQRYDEVLAAEVPAVQVPATMPGNNDVWHLYVVRVPERDRVLEELNRTGVGAGVHYPVPLHLTQAYAQPSLPAGSFPVAEQAASEILSLPIYPHITPDQQRRVVSSLAAVVGSAAAVPAR